MELKKIERLRWEYLNRSDDYKEFCEYMRKQRKNPKLSVPNKFKKNKRGNNHPIVSTFIRNGDIHSFSFNDWWEIRKEQVRMTQERKLSQSVRDYSDLVETDIQRCVDSFKRSKGREPTLEEFKDYFVQSFRDSGILYLMVSVIYKTSDLVKSFKGTVQDFRKNNLYQPNHLYHKKRDELERYLKVYVLWKQKIKMKDIIKEIGTKSQKDDCDNANIQRAFRADLAKAKKIIKNVERGQFPGKY